MEQHSFGNATECPECGAKFTVLYGPRRICEGCLNKQDEAVADAAPAEENKEGKKTKTPGRWRNIPDVSNVGESDAPGIEPVEEPGD